ncbi:LADA_0F14752g1_1 [Lachancea dasiensis]|uniref:LADA_0F14752g1_1 n=1 Tax=Lachancea dasiensis TaxID=1072105 RepID=A0A1G4JNS5_9SACH|nr:LADA_0F14752g1_1 [Lachancea dasiensis]
MDSVSNKLELASQLFLIYLDHSGLLADNPNIRLKEASKKNIELRVDVNNEVASAGFKRDHCDELEIILMDISGGEKCMISVCVDEESVRQGIVNYERELVGGVSEISFPMEKNQVVNYYTPNLDSTLEAKFHFYSKRDANRELRESGHQSKDPADYSAVHQRLERLKFGSPMFSSASKGETRRKIIPDMPGFDDEYEVTQEAGIPVTGEFGVPGLATGYGDQDLYPGGQKYPNFQDPSLHPTVQARPPGRGGMAFDPFRTGGDERIGDPHSGPLGGEPKGPRPPFPGAKFDDPFGRSQFHGSGGGFI